MIPCFHCGEECAQFEINYHDKSFCCNGCKTVYEIFSENDLSYYYDLDKTPGLSPNLTVGKFDFLDNEDIVQKLLEFDSQGTQIVSFLIPSIHCSSCIWVLENLNKLNTHIKTSQVNFPEKTIQITFSSESLTLKDLVLLLNQIGYEPSISLENYAANRKQRNRSLIYKLGVAGFAFGNIMFLSFPEYFEVNEFWLDRYKHLFRGLMLAFSLPVVFYSGSDYFISAYKGLRSKLLNIDVPIALGISVLFIRSTIDIVLNEGSGFFDSLTGLIFFLLLGKLFQQKTYSFLSFERDYKSYFPIAVTRIGKTKAVMKPKQYEDKSEQTSCEEQVQVYKIKQGDRILIRNEELIPMDTILLKGNALIDYSFVTGEAQPVIKKSGDKLFAGGKQKGGVIELEVLKPVEQSYLTQLWSNEIFSKGKANIFQTLTNRISKRFTVWVLTIAIVATLFWLVIDPTKAFNVFTAVLIVACPCAIALAAPFTLGNLLRIFGRNQFYIKEASVIEQLAQIDTVVFDKTGTLTSNKKNTITYEGVALTKEEASLLTSTLRSSNHPLSRALYDILDKNNIQTLDQFNEALGEGISACVDNKHIKVGSYAFVENQNSPYSPTSTTANRTAVHVSSNNQYKGCFIFHNDYRQGVLEVFKDLEATMELIVLSGDNEGEKEYLSNWLPKQTALYFNQKPEDKLQFIKSLQDQGKKVMMIGDGLNDAGALVQSNVGVVISEDINVFSPACDAILDATQFKNITSFFRFSQKGIDIIKWSFILSLCYNLIGLSFAVTGHLKPVVAAILMPLSSISIVVFTTVMTQILGRNIRREK